MFYGTREYDQTDGAPGRMQVFFPSTDGAVRSAPFLANCGRYPLILFLHGNCDEADHFRQWHRIPATLARCGYVVAVPELPGTANGRHPSLDENEDPDLVEQVYRWMLENWDYHAHLESATVGVAGHSYGALVAGRVRERIPFSAFMSVSGAWFHWAAFPMRSLDMPVLFTWGSDDDIVEVNSILVTPSGQDSGLWGDIPPPKHRLVFANGHHWDYLRAGSSNCEDSRGSCNLVEGAAADIAALFFSKNMPPSQWVGDLPGLIPDDLTVPEYDLTHEQEFFAGAHLTSLSLLPSRDGCDVTLSWELQGGGSGTRSLT